MKKFLFYTGIIFLVVGMVSCGNDDDQVVAEERVLGIWNIDRMLIDENFLELNECERRSSIQFFAAGIFREEIFEGENPTTCTSLAWKEIGAGLIPVLTNSIIPMMMLTSVPVWSGMNYFCNTQRRMSCRGNRNMFESTERINGWAGEKR